MSFKQKVQEYFLSGRFRAFVPSLFCFSFLTGGSNGCGRRYIRFPFRRTLPVQEPTLETEIHDDTLEELLESPDVEHTSEPGSETS